MCLKQRQFRFLAKVSNQLEYIRAGIFCNGYLKHTTSTHPLPYLTSSFFRHDICLGSSMLIGADALHAGICSLQMAFMCMQNPFINYRSQCAVSLRPLTENLQHRAKCRRQGSVWFHTASDPRRGDQNMDGEGDEDRRAPLKMNSVYSQRFGGD